MITTAIFYIRMAPAVVCLFVLAYFAWKDAQKAAKKEAKAAKKVLPVIKKFYVLKEEYKSSEHIITDMIGIQAAIPSRGIPYDSILAETVIRPHNFTRFFNLIERED